MVGVASILNLRGNAKYLWYDFLDLKNNLYLSLPLQLLTEYMQNIVLNINMFSDWKMIDKRFELSAAQ